VLVYSFVLTYLIALLIKSTIGLRISEDDEVAGIDTAEHAESAYEFAGLGTAGSGSLTGVPHAPAQVKVHS
jgi:Amt family ammonium transporter